MSLLVSGCFKSESGYGHKAREILYALSKKYSEDMNVLTTSWGTTPNDGLSKSQYAELEKLIKPFQLTKQPDLHIHVGVPNDFANLKFYGKKNILFTSGVETNIIPIEWIHFLNNVKVDLIVVPSTFTRDVMVKTVYTEKTKEEKLIEHRLTRPVIVIPESYDTRIFEPLSDESKQKIEDLLAPLSNKKFFFTFGQVSTMSFQETGIDRKNVSGLIKNFVTTFSGDHGVALVLKTNPIDFSEISYYHQMAYFKKAIRETNVPLKDRPEILLIKGYLEPNEMFYLFNHPNNIANVTYTFGEGFGRFLLEGAISGNRMITPKSGGFKDFTSNSFCSYINGKMRKIPSGAVMQGILTPDSEWFEVDYKEASKLLKLVYKEKTDFKMTNVHKNHIANLTNNYSIDYISSLILTEVDKHYTKEIVVDESLFSNLTETVPTINS